MLLQSVTRMIQKEFTHLGEGQILTEPYALGTGIPVCSIERASTSASRKSCVVPDFLTLSVPSRAWRYSPHGNAQHSARHSLHPRERTGRSPRPVLSRGWRDHYVLSRWSASKGSGESRIQTMCQDRHTLFGTTIALDVFYAVSRWAVVTQPSGDFAKYSE